MTALRPPFVTMLRRAVMLQCAWCGARPGFLRGWFKRHDSCQHCGLSVQRGHDGFELGAATVNAMILELDRCRPGEARDITAHGGWRAYHAAEGRTAP